MREKWAEAGLTTRDEMQIACCYAVQVRPGFQTRTGASGKFSSSSETFSWKKAAPV